MDWVGIWWDRLGTALQHPAFHAAFLAVLIGMALTEALAHVLPARLERKFAEKIIRVAVAIFVIWFGLKLHPTSIGTGWAIFAGLSAPSIHHHLQSWAYAKWPTLKPKALR